MSVRIASGISFLVFGVFGFIGQLISAIDFRFAQRLGLQEVDRHTDPIHRQLELNAARWDVFVLWTLPVTGVLMLVRTPKAERTAFAFLSLMVGAGVWSALYGLITLA